MAGVKFEHVYKRFNKVEVVHDITMDIVDKEFLVLVGPSGCGKSTVLRMIAGLEDVTEGEIYIGDRVVNNVDPKDRDIAMVFQNYALYPHMTVYDNMAFGLKLRHIPAQEIKKRVEDAADILGMQKLLKRKPKELSGGQRQRVALGRALVRSAQVFLLDEPLSNLDAKLRVQTRAEISKIHQRVQTTFVYVTHDQTEAMTMGDRIVVMNKGLIQQCADPMSVYDQPVNKFVASFIGSPPINFMNGRIIKKDRKYFFDEGKFQIKLIDGMYAKIAPHEGHEVTLGIRSEDIYDKLFASEASPENTVRATCEVVEPLGSEVYLYLNSGKHSFIARVGAHDRPEVNRDMDLVFDMSKVHFFDSKTEETII